MQQGATFGRRGVQACSPPPATVPICVEESDERLSRIPWATLGVIALLAAGYALELMTGAASGGRPSQATLLHLGGISRNLAFHHGQVWRLLTAPLLHANAVHIAGNAVALLLIGWLLEPIVGWRWFIAIYVVSGIGGALASAMLNPVDALSVGASGAIVGLLGSAMVLSLHAASYDRRKKIWVMCFRVGVPALLPTASVTAHHIDYSAHTGGAMVGMALGYLLLIAWNGARTRPPWQIAAGAAGGILGLVSLGALEVAALLPSAAAAPKVTAGLLPSDQMPSSVAEAARLSPK